MTWEEHRWKMPTYEEFQTRKLTDIECPKCGKRLWKRMDIVLMSDPVQYQYECICGWIGYAFS